MIAKSLTAQLQHKFHISAAEIDEQDTHRIKVIGVAGIGIHGRMTAEQFLGRKTEAGA